MFINDKQLKKLIRLNLCIYDYFQLSINSLNTLSIFIPSLQKKLLFWKHIYLQKYLNVHGWQITPKYYIWWMWECFESWDYNSRQFKYRKHYSNEKVIVQMQELCLKIKYKLIIFDELINLTFAKKIYKRKQQHYQNWCDMSFLRCLLYWFLHQSQHINKLYNN